MKTILFCAATLLFSGIAMGQQANVKGQQAASAAGTVSKKPGNVQASGAVDARSKTEVNANPKPAVEASHRATASTKSEVSQKSRAAVVATKAQAENTQEFAASQVVQTKTDVKSSGKTVVKAEKPVAGKNVSVRTNNKTSTAASIDGAQNISTRARVMKQKKARARTRGNISTNSSVRPGSIHTSGMIRTSIGLGL